MNLLLVFLLTFSITPYLPTLSTSLSFDTRVLLDSAWLFSAGRLGARVAPGEVDVLVVLWVALGHSLACPWSSW